MKISLKEVKRFFSKPKGMILLILIIILILGIIISILLGVFQLRACTDESCFNLALVGCKKIGYIKNSQDTIIHYVIKGKEDGLCKVDVTMIQVKRGSNELYSLEGKGMQCLIPEGTYVIPEEDIAKCHGLLKESIQEIIIQRMHSQIVENIGKISEEVTEVL